MDAAQLLQLVIIGLSGWTLREVYRIAREVERIKQKMSDLPCEPCPNNTNEES